MDLEELGSHGLTVAALSLAQHSPTPRAYGWVGSQRRSAVRADSGITPDIIEHDLEDNGEGH